MRRVVAYLCSFLAALWLVWLPPVRAQESETIPTIVENVAGAGNIELPDWARLTIRTLPAFLESGEIRVPGEVAAVLGYDPSRSWEAGASVADVLLLGDWGRDEVFGLAQFSVRAMGEILGFSRSESEGIAISEHEVIGRQTIAELVRAIPGLEDLPIEEIAPIAEFAANVGFGTEDGLSGSSVGDLARSVFGESSPIGQYVDLAAFALGSIPGATQTPLQEFAHWAEVAAARVPYLQDIPFSDFPNAIESAEAQATRAGAVVARADVVWGPSEYGDGAAPRGYFVSGGTQSHFTVPVACQAGVQCPYVELTALGALLNGFGAGPGHRWVSGRAQEVSGGHGVLGNVNNGREPTGRLVFGNPFKVALLDTIEHEGRGTFGLYFRICIKYPIDLGCTPYFIGPIPWLPTREGNLLLLAGADAPYKAPRQYPQEIEQATSEYEPVSSREQAGEAPAADEGDRSAEETAPTDCIDAVTQAAPSALRSYARQYASLLIEESRRAGLSDAQTAYVLATAHHESLWGKAMKEYKEGQGKPYGSWYGRGFVQLTWKYNYIYWSNRLGVDLVGDPARATDPNIAAKIIVLGMRDGTFTAMTPEGTFLPHNATRLDRFISGDRVDFVGARRIINGRDRASQIAGYARKYHEALQSCRSSASSSSARLTGRRCNPVRGLCSARTDFISSVRRKVV